MIDVRTSNLLKITKKLISVKSNIIWSKIIVVSWSAENQLLAKLRQGKQEQPNTVILGFHAKEIESCFTLTYASHSIGRARNLCEVKIVA